MNLDRIDQKIIRLLEGNSRLSFAELAEEVGLSKTPCWKRVKALEDAGVIRGYSLVVDPAKMGFGLEAFVQVTISPERYADFEAAVVRHPLIRRCHATTGEDDYLLQIIAVDMAPSLPKAMFPLVETVKVGWGWRGSLCPSPLWGGVWGGVLISEFTAAPPASSPPWAAAG